MKAKDITICPNPDCPVCALDAKIMEAVEAYQPDGPEPGAERCVGLAHAMARVLYDESKNADLAVERIVWLMGVTAKAYNRLATNDTRTQ